MTTLSEPGTGYECRLARTDAEVEAALRLRFEVFNIELGEGLEDSRALGLDRDRFDDVMDHLVVTSPAGEIVGTYRLQTGITAANNLGYYSQGEFDMTPFEPVRGEVVELGRACVRKGHRSLSVVSMLWRGILTYALERGGRYLIGCSSLSSRDPNEGAALYEVLAASHLVPEEFRTLPHPHTAAAQDERDSKTPKIPRLLRAYLAVGAKICGPPAIDRQFGTIDFLTFLDCRKGTVVATEHFLGRLEQHVHNEQR